MKLGKALVVVTLLTLVFYGVAAALGMVPFNPLAKVTGKVPATSGKVVVLNSFERATQGLLRADSYIELKRVKANSTHGKWSLQAKLFLKDYFYPTPTPPVPHPGATPIPERDWQPTIYYAYDSASPLKRADWRGFDYFKMDVILGEDRPANCYLVAGDARSYRYQAPTQVLQGKKVNVLALDVNNMKKNYLDISKIQYVAFVFDIAGRGSPPLIYLDNFRLERTAN